MRPIRLLSLAYIALLLGCGGNGNDRSTITEAHQRGMATTAVQSMRATHSLLLFADSATRMGRTSGFVDYGDGLYYTMGSEGGDTLLVQFFNDPEHHDSAGTLTLAKTSEGLDYPRSYDATLNIAGETPVAGEFTVTRLDESRTRLLGRVTATGGPATTTDFDLQVTPNRLTGSIAATRGGQTVTLDNVDATLEGRTGEDDNNGTMRLAADVAVTPPGIQTTLDLTLSPNGSGELEFGEGVAATWDDAGNGTLTLIGGRTVGIDF